MFFLSICISFDSVEDGQWAHSTIKRVLCVCLCMQSAPKEKNNVGENTTTKRYFHWNNGNKKISGVFVSSHSHRDNQSTLSSSCCTRMFSIHFGDMLARFCRSALSFSTWLDGCLQLPGIVFFVPLSFWLLARKYSFNEKKSSPPLLLSSSQLKRRRYRRWNISFQKWYTHGSFSAVFFYEIVLLLIFNTNRDQEIREPHCNVAFLLTE